jgi:hypothetical protein
MWCAKSLLPLLLLPLLPLQPKVRPAALLGLQQSNIHNVPLYNTLLTVLQHKV